MLVKEVMTPHVVSIAPEESAALAARLLARHGLGRCRCARRRASCAAW